MQLHHDKHHAAYVNNLNAALQNAPQFAALPIEQLIQRLNEVPDTIRTAVRNNGGGHLNHNMFLQIMTPNGCGQPGGGLGNSNNSTLGSLQQVKAAFINSRVKS